MSISRNQHTLIIQINYRFFYFHVFWALFLRAQSYIAVDSMIGELMHNIPDLSFLATALYTRLHAEQAATNISNLNAEHRVQQFLNIAFVRGSRLKKHKITDI